MQALFNICLIWLSRITLSLILINYDVFLNDYFNKDPFL